MRIALDATYSLDRAPTGVGVYCSRLIGALAAQADGSRFLLCYRPRRFLRSLAEPLPAPGWARSPLLEPLDLLLPRRVELFHGLNQRLPRRRFQRSVTTFHDLFVMTGEYSTPEFRKRFTALARDAASRSDHVIAVSSHTAGQVESLLGIERSRISVIHHGVDPVPAFSPEDLAAFRRRWRLERPFLLHVGAIQARKNLLRLMDAFEKLDGDLDLALAGSSGYAASPVEERARRNPRIRLLGYVEQPVLQRLYRSAAALAFPSLDEGFGLPVLEAMSAALPVVTSNRSATAEVAGGAALLVDPASTEELAAALDRAARDTVAREALIGRGRERAAQFCWGAAAARTLEVYRRLL